MLAMSSERKERIDGSSIRDGSQSATDGTNEQRRLGRGAAVKGARGWCGDTGMLRAESLWHETAVKAASATMDRMGSDAKNWRATWYSVTRRQLRAAVP